MNEPRPSERNEPPTSEDEESTPRPKRHATKTQVVDDGISEITSAGDPEYGVNQGDDDDEDEEEPDTSDDDEEEGEEPDTPDLGTVEDNTLGGDVDEGQKKFVRVIQIECCQRERERAGAKSLSSLLESCSACSYDACIYDPSVPQRAHRWGHSARSGA